MSYTISIINDSSMSEMNEQLTKALDEKIQEWENEYIKEKVPVTIVVKDAESKLLYKVLYSKKISDELNEIEDGIGKNLLMTRVAVCLRPWEKKYEGKVCFHIYIGLTEDDVLKKSRLGDKDGKHQPSLDICPIEPKFSMEQVVLPEKTKAEIKDVIGLLQNISKIYNDWGFKEIDPVPRSIVNLWGPPGTGKQ